MYSRTSSVTTLGNEFYDYNDSETSDTPENEVKDKETIPVIAHEILLGLNQFRETRKFCDIILKVDDISIPAHRIVLRSCSPYFNCLFNGRFKDAEAEVVDLHDIEGKYLKLVIDYIYTGKLSVTSDNVQNTLKVANFLQIKSAEDICCTVLSEDIDINNCIEFLRLAHKCSLKILFVSCAKCIIDNFYDIYDKDEFLNLDYQIFCGFLDQKATRHFIQDGIFSAIHKWVTYSPDRLEKFDKLVTYLDSSRLTENLIKSSPFYKEKDSSLSNLKTKEEETIYLYSFNRIRPCSHKMTDDAYVISKIKQLPVPLYQCSYTAYGNCIYAQGGWTCEEKKEGTFTTQSFIYDTFEKNWTKFIPLTLARSDHRSCAFDGRLYTIGGRRNLDTFHLVECLDLFTGRYVETEGLHKERASFGLVTYENCIYVIGGHDSTEYSTTIERFDPRIGKWDILSTKPFSKGICSSAILDDRLYCTFGLGKAMERYDFKADKWTVIKTLNDVYPREFFTVDGKLFGTFRKKIMDYSTEQIFWDNPQYTFATKWLTIVVI